MTAADQIRALADTGTPGPLREASWAERGLRTLRSTRDDVWLADVRDHGDAAKIVAAVNALPEVADYDDAVMAYFQHQTECTSGPSCPTYSTAAAASRHYAWQEASTWLRALIEGADQ